MYLKTISCGELSEAACSILRLLSQSYLSPVMEKPFSSRSGLSGLKGILDIPEMMSARALGRGYYNVKGQLYLLQFLLCPSNVCGAVCSNIAIPRFLSE